MSVITAIIQGKRDGERVNVYLNGKFWQAVDLNTMVHFGLHKGMELSECEIGKITIYDSERLLYRRLLEAWHRRPQSKKELLTRMRKLRPEASEEVYANVLARLEKDGYQDEAFAIWYAKQRFASGKYGKHRVNSELRSKGVNPDIAKQALSEVYQDDISLAETALEKKFGVKSLNEIKDLKEKSQAYRFLKSRGF